MSEQPPKRVPIECPVPPAPRASAYTRTLRHACLILGGIAALATHLGIAQAPLRQYMEGMEAPPEPVFLSALEVVLLHLSAVRTQN